MRLLLKHQVEDVGGLISHKGEGVGFSAKKFEDLEQDIENIQNELVNSEKKLSEMSNVLFENRKKYAPV